MWQNPYQYDDTINPKTGKGKHSHLLDIHGTSEYKRLTGTSSVVDVLSKVLTWWASGEAVKTLGWIHPDIKKNGRIIGKVPLEDRLAAAKVMLDIIKLMTPQEYLDLLDKAYRAHSVKLTDTAAAGTDLHAELERYVKSKMGLNDAKRFPAQIKPFIKWAEHAVKEYVWSEEHCYHEKLWVGGISDVGCILNGHTFETPEGQVEVPDGTLAVLDFKSAKEYYTSQFIQAGGYALQVEKNGLFDKDGNFKKKIDRPVEALVIVAFGQEVVYPEVRLNANIYKEAFELCLRLYRILGMDKSEYQK